MKKLIPLAFLAGIIVILIIAFQILGGRDQNQKNTKPTHSEQGSRKVKPPRLQKESGSEQYEDVDTDLLEEQLPVKERIKKLIDIANNAEMFDATFQALLEEDPDAVFAYLNSVQFPEPDPDHPDADHFFNQILFVAKNLDHYFRDENFDDMLGVLDSISDSPHLYDATLQEIISTSVGTHEGKDTPQYEQIYNWVKNNPETIAADNAGTSIGGMLYLSDPENGWKKAMELPEGRIRTEAITTIMTQSYVDDIGIASEILNQIEMTPDLDHAVLNLVRHGLEQNNPPSSLVDWAASITDEDLRIHTLELTIHAWQRQSPEELALWVEQAYPEDPRLRTFVELLHKQAVNNVYRAE